MVDSHDAETYSAKDSRLIWIDCEMTGLDIFGGDELVEVSVVPTDFDLNVLDEGVDYVIKPSEKAVNHMNDFVRQMHTRSGLINEWENGLSLAEAEQKVTDYVLRFTPEGVKPLLAGNTIGSDKKFLDHYMPNLMSHLHYRSVDVSTLKELARRWYPAVYENRPPKNGATAPSPTSSSPWTSCATTVRPSWPPSPARMMPPPRPSPPTSWPPAFSISSPPYLAPLPEGSLERLICAKPKP